ncbi:MAG: hypothetical protein LUI14_07035 [Lachnospiraceae bacterium]|nr:hypothetical protein [Lachnospiraceae bacterium]
MAKIPEWMRELDLEATVTADLNEYEYTRRAARSMRHMINSEEFEELDRETIYNFLKSRKGRVPFNEYLRRYVYTHAGMEELGTYSEIDEKEYCETIKYAFRDNNAPYALNTTKKLSATVKGWLEQESAQRKTVFFLGFGLNMKPEEVSEFLTKALLETDFNFRDPLETIYWYCYQNQYSYAKAEILYKQYLGMKAKSLKEGMKEENVEDLLNDPACALENDEGLLNYLSYLKGLSVNQRGKKNACAVFADLWQELREQLAQAAAESEHGDEIWTADKISGAYVENALLYGIPKEANGNMVNMNRSTLYTQFGKKRFNRQRVSRILKDGEIDRMDLTTVTFLLAAIDDESFNNNMERYETYLKQTNAMLQDCEMGPLYPANPYEAFIMACLMTEEPLDVYNDVLAMSYAGE